MLDTLFMDGLYTDLERLSQMQNYDGGFAFWERGRPSGKVLTPCLSLSSASQSTPPLVGKQAITCGSIGRVTA